MTISFKSFQGFTALRLLHGRIQIAKLHEQAQIYPITVCGMTVVGNASSMLLDAMAKMQYMQ